MVNSFIRPMVDELTIETRAKLVEIGLCGPLQIPLTNIMNVLGYWNEDSVGASWVGIKEDMLLLWRIATFIVKCDEDVKMRREMFILCRTKGIVQLQGPTWRLETESLAEFTTFMELRYKGHEDEVYTEGIEQVDEKKEDTSKVAVVLN